MWTYGAALNQVSEKTPTDSDVWRNVSLKRPKTNTRFVGFEDCFENGVWLEITVQSGENIVGIGNGVYRAAGILRYLPDQKVVGNHVGQDIRDAG